MKYSAFLVLQLIVTRLAAASVYNISHGFSSPRQHLSDASPSSEECSQVLPLRLQSFPSWAKYLLWRQTISPECAKNRPIQPCVWDLKQWTCLPKLVVIGTQKGGTTGLRNMLIATGLFMSMEVTSKGRKIYPEGNYFGKNLPSRGRNLSYQKLLEGWFSKAGRFPSDVRWSDLADENGFARKISIDVSPQYSQDLVQHEIEWILRINPDVHFLLLARDPSGAAVSVTDMHICARLAPKGSMGSLKNPGAPGRCGNVGCDFRPGMSAAAPELFPAVTDVLKAVKTCTPETIPCSMFHRQLEKLTALNQRQELKYMPGEKNTGIPRRVLAGVRGRARKELKYRQELKKERSGERVHGYYFHGRWRYPWVLHQQWLQVVPKHQMHVIRTDYLWDEPQLVLDTIAGLLQLPFTIPAVTNFATKPDRQTKCRCSDAEANRKAFYAIVERCQLKEAISCAHFHSNELMQELMASRFPYGSPPGKPFLEWNRGMSVSECEKRGYGVDVRYDILLQ